jgi:hypothetical protein
VDEILISVDVETGGPVPGLFPLLALGACLVDPAEEPNPVFYRELKPVPADRFDAAAVEVSFPGLPAARSIARLERDGEDPAAVARDFADWVAEVADSGKPVFVGFNAGFDWAFALHLFGAAGIENPFGFAPFDIKSFWAGKAGVPFHETSKSKLPPELSDGLSEHNHRADDDARRQAVLFRRMRARAGSR